MDLMSGVLRGPRAEEAFLLRIVMSAPWSIDIRDEAPLTVAAIMRGEAYLHGSGEPELLVPGDIALIRGPDHYTMADTPNIGAPQVIIRPDQSCTTADGVSLQEPMSLGIRTWGNDGDGDTEILVGTYPRTGEVSARLLNALPQFVIARGGTGPVVDLLSAEMRRDAPGQDAMLDRLLDLVLISTLRDWFDSAGAATPAWYRAEADPVAGRALRLMHNNPEFPWTVAGLAAECGVSRAAFARRFAEHVGEPPMTYLTNWRLALAADLLADPGVTLESVARAVGYSDAFAFSSAFKRVRGVSPTRHRALLA
ncbi:AraC family transcriptional regulator [Jongsikchunia kroppenstedtii]|uniref:AraC family transcriptional regulator n=1 Tax=Jongsikchunia kroppenstedtii TaxID=1121721 RepID=UPI00036AC6B7|nr:AraC family transcriptional regulator [Jongsikchunia kroppenstedtii]